MNIIKKITPTNFLCRYPLATGGVCGIIVFICATAICTLALIAQVILMKDCTKCTGYVWRNAYGFSMTGVIYCIIMLAMHGWTFWGIKKKKASVLLSWVVITTMWLAQTLSLLIILITIHSSDVNVILWLISFIMGMVSISILVYFILIMFGLWLQLKGDGRNPNVAAVDT